MNPTSSRRVVASVLLLAVAALVVGVSSAGGASAVGKPVIAKPATTPAKPIAGKAFAVSFAVTRSDTHARLTTGRMICDPSVTGKVIQHQESFKGGTARLAFVIPSTAGGKLLKVKVTIKADGGSTTRIANFRVLQAPKPALSIKDASVAEGNSGTTALSVPVTLSAASSLPVSVRFTTGNGTAIAPADFVAGTGKLTFKPGETAKTAEVSIVGDTAVEEDETLTVTLFSPVNATVAATTATLTITNDDQPSLSITSVSAAEGNSGTTAFSVPVTLSTASTKAVSVHFATSDGTATAPGDYVTSTGTVTFQPGETAKAVPVSIVGDTTVEPNETFTVTLSSPVNATIAGGAATVTINNDDVAVPRSGHYAGTTSQGRSIAFDVSGDASTLSNIIFNFDLTCTEISATLPNEPFDLSGATVGPLQAPNWAWAFSIPYTDPDGSGSMNTTMSGKLTAPGSASGTFRIDFIFTSINGVGPVHCTSGAVTWNAS